jgi:pilus assembly protein Flp/PilA
LRRSRSRWWIRQPTVSFFKGISCYVEDFIGIREAALRLRDNQDGVVSFEYVIVGACIVAAVLAAFGTDATTGIGKALSDSIGKITAKLP